MFDDRLQSGELLVFLKKGDEEAFTFLFTKYYEPLFCYASRIMNSAGEAEECVQSTFCHLWDIRKRLEIRDSIKSYLYRSVYNTCITALRKRQALAKYETSGELDLFFSRIVQNPHAEMQLIESETRREVLRTINELPQKCREVFVKCKMEGLSYAETAARLNISVNTVESQMSIAYKKLREKLNWLLLMYLA